MWKVDLIRLLIGSREKRGKEGEDLATTEMLTIKPRLNPGDIILTVSMREWVLILWGREW